MSAMIPKISKDIVAIAEIYFPKSYGGITKGSNYCHMLEATTCNFPRIVCPVMAHGGHELKL